MLHLNVVPKVAATMVIVDMDNAIATLDFQENIAMLLSNAQKDAVDMVNAVWSTPVPVSSMSKVSYGQAITAPRMSATTLRKQCTSDFQAAARMMH